MMRENYIRGNYKEKMSKPENEDKEEMSKPKDKEKNRAIKRKT